MAEIISALTASGHKSICVYDIRLNLLGRIESWVSLVWPERYNVYSDTQGAQLELHDTTALQALCRPDRYLWLVGSDRHRQFQYLGGVFAFGPNRQQSDIGRRGAGAIARREQLH